MFFTKAARLVAWLIFIPSALRHIMAWSIALEWVGPYQWAIDRYLGGEQSGPVMTKTLLYVVAAVALGTLAEISRHLHNAKAE